jgi:hypothetical protein
MCVASVQLWGFVRCASSHSSCMLLLLFSGAAGCTRGLHAPTSLLLSEAASRSAAFVCVLCSPCSLFSLFSCGIIAGTPLPSLRPGSRPSMQGGFGSLLASSVDVVDDLHLGCIEVTAIPICFRLFCQVLPVHVGVAMLSWHLHIVASLRDSVSFIVFVLLPLSPCCSPADCRCLLLDLYAAMCIGVKSCALRNNVVRRSRASSPSCSTCCSVQVFIYSAFIVASTWNCFSIACRFWASCSSSVGLFSRSGCRIGHTLVGPVGLP